MPKINIIVRKKIAQAVGDTHIVCGNSDYTAVFDFDEEWDAYETKTARFIWNGKYTDVVFSGSECPIPVILDAFGVLVGVYAGDLHTTTAATVDTEKSILCRNGLPTEPKPDVYAQLLERLNGMENPDWAENDSAKPGYVKNRTHYDSRRTIELFNVTVENISEDGYVKLADADIDISKITRLQVNTQYSVNDEINTFTFDSDGGNVKIEDDPNIDDAVIIRFTVSEDNMFFLFYFKTSKAADEFTNTTGVYGPGLYVDIYQGDIKDTFIGYSEVGELKTIDPKFIHLKLPYIIQEKEDGNVKIELPYEFVEGEKYRAIYTVSGIEDKKVEELVAVYSNAAGKVGIFQGGEDGAENFSVNCYYVLSGSDSMWVNEYWERSMKPVFDGIYRVVEPGYSIPSYAVDGLEESINAEIDRFEKRYDTKMLEEAGDWKEIGSKTITSDTNEINTTTLFGASNFSNVGKILVKLDLIITSLESDSIYVNFQFNTKNMGFAKLVSSSTNKKTYWLYATRIYEHVLCILFEGNSSRDSGDINIKSMQWENNQGIQYIKINTGNPGYNVIAKGTKITIFKAKR